MSTDTQGVLGEISQRLSDMASATGEDGPQVVPPLLILGTSERVGSNWISDALRPAAVQHNEPFRQQIGPAHPWSALNPGFVGCENGLPAIGALGRHWLVSFAVSKYGQARQVVKETNLFFALPVLLALLPGAPVLVLSRCPLGVASSFARGDLFRRWGYRARYQQVVTMTRCGTSGRRRFAALVPDDEPPDLVALVRLQVLNTVLIADALAGRDLVHLAYETMITRPAAAVATLAAIAPDLTAVSLQGEHAVGQQRPARDDTFVTAVGKTDLTASLRPADAALVSATKTASLAVARALLPAVQADLAESCLAGDHLYRLEPPRQRQCRAVRMIPAVPEPVATGFVRQGGLEVRNTLVSNAEFAGFMNALADAGIRNGHGGTWLLACEMPHERGGRLHYDLAARQWQVSPGYGDYPVYWVTWIGAAAFAAWTGARLPARAELLRLTQDAALTGNAGYRCGDVAPVTEPAQPPASIHHLLGNLQLWCGDGPSGQVLVTALI